MTLKFPQRSLVSQQDSAMIERARIPRSRFDNTWSRLTAFNAGDLIPILVDEILPGDHMTYDLTAYVRMATPLFPMFSNQRVDTFFFFVPHRLVWTNFIRMMGEQTTPGASIDFTVPQVVSNVGGDDIYSMADHFGLPITGQIAAGQTLSVSALPFRGVLLIYNKWFKDQNITTDYTVPLGDGPDSYSSYPLPRRNKSHDYFTSALPWAQKFTAPTVPIAGQAPIIGLGAVNDFLGIGPVNVYETDRTAATAYANFKKAWVDPGVDPNEGGVYMRMSPSTLRPMVYADLTQATGVAINTFRQAFMIQTLLERDARGGTRYTELIRAHFDVINPDFRLQRPEYIGGGQTPLNLTPIAQTAPTVDGALGALGAAGTAAGSHRASYAATEHGYIIGLINVRTELAYQQGVPRTFSKLTRYDFYWPELAGLGEQAITRKEIFALGTAADDTVFGYQERWHEYRTRYSEVTGMMRSNIAGTLDAWHLAQDFSAAPTLSDAFIQDSPPMERVLAAGAAADKQQYLADLFFRRTAIRPIPTYGTPVSLGRF